MSRLAPGVMYGSDAQGDGLVLGEVEARPDAADGAHPELAVREILKQLTICEVHGVSAADGLARVEEVIDLANVRRKLADPEEGKGYTSAELDSMEREYRRYLALQLGVP